MKTLPTLLLAMLLPSCDTSKQNPIPAKQVRQDNGLTVLLRPVEGANAIALVTIFSIGEAHDPPGQSGMGHLIEHLYVTAAAGNTEARTVQEFVARYPQGWNAQTGRHYTVIAAVFPKERLDAELEDAAARMRKLDVDTDDLQREIPRLQLELANMHEGIPTLAAQNLAARLVVARRDGTRKGGVIEQIRSIELDQIRKRLDAYYKPGNATLVLAGAIDPDEARERIDAAFSDIAPGNKVPAAPEAKPSDQRSARQAVTPVVPQAQAHPAHVALAFATPEPTDELYPAYLVLVSRLQARSNQLQAPPGMFPVGYALLDRPEVVTLSLPAEDADAGAKQVLKKLQEYVAETVGEDLTEADITYAKQNFGFLLGLQDYPDAHLAKNLYGAAFSLGMRKRLKIEPDALREALDAVTTEDLKRSVEQYFAESRYATAAIHVERHDTGSSR